MYVHVDPSPHLPPHLTSPHLPPTSPHPTQAIVKQTRDEMRKVVEQSLAAPYPAQHQLYAHVLHTDKAHNIRGSDYWTRYSE